jgi:hypothetical protein
MILDNVEFLPPIFLCHVLAAILEFKNGRHLENFDNAELLL